MCSSRQTMHENYDFKSLKQLYEDRKKTQNSYDWKKINLKALSPFGFVKKWTWFCTKTNQESTLEYTWKVQEIHLKHSSRNTLKTQFKKYT